MLNKLKPSRGSRKRRKRVGRGAGSGSGLTCGRGHKGQMSRSGSSRRYHFEGGQMPLTRRVPKRGFNNINRVEYALIKVEDLKKFEEGSVVTPEVLRQAGLVKKNGPVKVLSGGELDRKITVKLHAFSAAARQAIEKSGSVAEVV